MRYAGATDAACPADLRATIIACIQELQKQYTVVGNLVRQAPIIILVLAILGWVFWITRVREVVQQALAERAAAQATTPTPIRSLAGLPPMPPPPSVPAQRFAQMPR